LRSKKNGSHFFVRASFFATIIDRIDDVLIFFYKLYQKKRKVIMKVNAHAFGLTGSILASIFYSSAIIAIKYSPYPLLQIFLSLYMFVPSRIMNFSLHFGGTIQITLKKYILGLSVHALAAYILFFIFAALYNRLTKS
jgi:hypothetical protein